MNLYGPMWSILVLACWAAVSGSALWNLIGGSEGPSRLGKKWQEEVGDQQTWGNLFILSVTPTCDRSHVWHDECEACHFWQLSPPCNPIGPELTHDLSIPFRITMATLAETELLRCLCLKKVTCINVSWNKTKGKEEGHPFWGRWWGTFSRMAADSKLL